MVVGPCHGVVARLPCMAAADARHESAAGQPRMTAAEVCAADGPCMSVPVTRPQFAVNRSRVTAVVAGREPAAASLLTVAAAPMNSPPRDQPRSWHDVTKSPFGTAASSLSPRVTKSARTATMHGLAATSCTAGATSCMTGAAPCAAGAPSRTTGAPSRITSAPSRTTGAASRRTAVASRRMTIHQASRGSVTAETATMLPALVIVLAAALLAIQAVAVQLQCVDAARAAARAAARGESLERVRAVARTATNPNARIIITRTTETTEVRITVSVHPSWATSLPPIPVSASATSATE
ncbi:TadE family type IV pilus minor pilin [Nonomuraea longicatena]|uniref:TadE family type IV pilus minor pilin n=1 Tax=Nonomuraea longicatena TaxID=83682 RepID=UPI0031DFDFE2